MPAKGTTKLTQQQKQKVALAKAVGKTHKEAAAAALVSEASVDRIVADPQTQLLIQRLRDQHSEQLERMYAAALTYAEKDLGDGSGDIRVRTRDQVLRFIQAGDRLKIGEGNETETGEYTLEELMISYRRRTEKVTPS
jgi:sugar diacid utilization regulator